LYSPGFVRQYARFLDVAPEELLSQLPKVDVENAPSSSSDEAKKPFWNSRGQESDRFGACAAAAAAWVYFI